jgi:hypothetical protein
VVDLEITARVTGAVTRMIPIPIEWASMFVDGPNFITAFRRVFYLFDALEEEERSALYPILEMMGVVCCTANDFVGAASTLSTQWACLMHHARTKRWAEEAWVSLVDPVKHAPPNKKEPPHSSSSFPVCPTSRPVWPMMQVTQGYANSYSLHPALGAPY